MSTTEKALKAKTDADALIQAAIKEQLEIIRDANNALKELGYKVATGGESSGGGKKPKQVRKTDPNAPCPICKFVTVPPHNRRQHRTIKKAFNAAQLTELGLKKK